MPRIESQRARDLLLEKLSSQDAEALGERVIVDGELADQLELETTDLLDDYTRGALSADDARRVETHLLLDGDTARRLSFAQTLNAYRSSEFALGGRGAPVRPRSAYLAMAVAACLVLALSFWLYAIGSREVNSVKIVKAPNEAPVFPSGPSASGPKQELVRRGIFTIALLSDKVRGSDETDIAVPANAQKVRFECQLPPSADADTYKIIVQEKSGHPPLSSPDLHATRSAEFRYVAADFPAADVHAGSYSIVVETNHSNQKVASFTVTLR